ncbi:UDP-glucose 4-epimerase [Salinibacter ruber]|uniref:NAD-dependent epimerase/dehydratase family protein n=1 Tax=Salinibacter ruber TaxID=146919 RepID=UPI002169F101|nr:NAD-dependent epimerase/dehydratase family protein [Salinibacter ruber]MCS4034095.1 UDP-glucose 4-epimerase [Salinibacter ruber]
MDWLITGGCGFIGTNLIHQLQEEGEHSIRVVDNLSEGARNHLGRVSSFVEKDREELGPTFSDEVELVVGDIRDPELANLASQGSEIIVHLAANSSVPKSIERPRHDCSTNVNGTLNYLEAARNRDVKRFIFASSVAPLGDCSPPIHEDMAPHPKAPYGASKLAGEGYCSAYQQTYGVQTAALRFANVYGPLSEHKESVVAKFIRRALHGDPLEVYGDGQQTRDFVHTNDLVRAIQLAASQPKVNGEIFQIATNSETTLNSLVEMLVPIIESVRDVGTVDVVHTKPRHGDIRRNYADTSKAEQILGWTPEVQLDEGLKETVRSFRQ